MQICIIYEENSNRVSILNTFGILFKIHLKRILPKTIKYKPHSYIQLSLSYWIILAPFNGQYQ